MRQSTAKPNAATMPPLLSRRAALRLALGGVALALPAWACGRGSEPPSPPTLATAAYPDRHLLATVADVRMPESDELRLLDLSPQRDYRAGHIPDASHLWWQDTIEIHNNVYGMLTGAPTRARIAQEAGITSTTPVVCYDDAGGVYAARALWMLHYESFFNVRLLDGGRQAWQADGGELTTANANIPGGGFEPMQNESVLAHGHDILNRLDDPGYVIVDTRTAAERSVTWYDQLRKGQIPGAHWLPRDQWLNDTGTALVAPDTLRNRLAAAGVPPVAQEIVTYGLHGTLACLGYVALRSLGYTGVRVYDGSWAEWGATDEWPIAPLTG